MSQNSFAFLLRNFATSWFGKLPVQVMKRSVVNFDAVKEIISGGRTYTGTTKFFCGLPTITPRQFVGAVAFLIDDIISGKKNRLLNFIGRLKIKWRTLTKKFTVPHR